jgi:hypothetical protein
LAVVIGNIDRGAIALRGREPHHRFPEKDKEGCYEAEVQTKDGSLLDKIQVDKYTGWFRSEYVS